MRVFIIVFVVLSIFGKCSSVDRIPTKLDLSEEKKIIINDKSIPAPQKDFIINTLEKAENSCKENIEIINNLNSEIKTLKEEIKELDEQAKIYRYVRNIIIGLLLSYIVYRLRDYILPLVKRLLNLPI